MISISRYVKYAHNNYGVHAILVRLPGLSVWFSYSTPIAFMSDAFGGMVMRKNDWGPTTGRHMREISSYGIARLLPGKEFEEALGKAIQLGCPPANGSKIKIVEKLVEVDRVRKIVVPKVYKTVCESCKAKEAALARAEKRERNIVL